MEAITLKGGGDHKPVLGGTHMLVFRYRHGYGGGEIHWPVCAKASAGTPGQLSENDSDSVRKVGLREKNFGIYEESFISTPP